MALKKEHHFRSFLVVVNLGHAVDDMWDDGACVCFDLFAATRFVNVTLQFKCRTPICIFVEASKRKLIGPLFCT